MEIAIQEIIELQPLYGIIKNKILPVKTSYKFAKLFKTIEEHYNFYQNQINLIITEYSEKDEAGNPIHGESNGIKIKSDKLEECEQKVNELINLKVEIPDLSFNLEEIESLDLTLEQFMLLIKYCQEEEKADS